MVAILDGDTLLKKEKENSKLRMGGGSWSINLDKQDLIKIKTIIYQTEKHTYTISTKDAMDHGFIRILGGEKKLVVGEKYWTKT
jgi:hypothetical protein